MAREMKDSGIDWIGEIPSEWGLIRLSNYTERLFLGRTPVYSESANENYIIGQKNNQKTGVVFEGVKYGTDEFYKGCPQPEFLNYGDVLLNTLGGGSVGRIGYWNINNTSKYLTDGHIMVLRAKKYLSSRYLYYSMYCQQKLLEDESVGSTNQAFLTVSQIYKKKIPLPTPDEQSRIAAFLDRRCAEIDSVIADTRRTIEEYKALKQSIITEAVTKGVRGKRPMKDSGSVWFGEIPTNWNMTRLKYMFHIKKDIAGQEGYTVLSITQKGIIPKNIAGNEGQLAADYSHYQLVEPGDFAMNHMDLLTGWIDISCYAGVTSPDYRVFVLDDENSSKEYYLYLMQMCYSNKIFYGLGQGVSGMGRWRLQADKFLNFFIPVPPFEEQIEIAAELKKKQAEMDSLIVAKEQFCAELESYKKSVIYEYATGKKEVPSDRTETVAVSPIFLKALLYAKTQETFGDECRGKVQIQKMLYMLEGMLNLNLNSRFVRKKFGPLDVELDEIEAYLEQQKWLKVINSNPATYIILENHGAYRAEYKKHFGRFDSEIQRILRYFIGKRSSEAERFATLLAVWNDFLLDGDFSPTDEKLIREACTNWHPRKANFKVETWQDTLRKMRENNFIPHGYAAHTIPATEGDEG